VEINIRLGKNQLPSVHHGIGVCTLDYMYSIKEANHSASRSWSGYWSWSLLRIWRREGSIWRAEGLLELKRWRLTRAQWALTTRIRCAVWRIMIRYYGRLWMPAMNNSDWELENLIRPQPVVGVNLWRSVAAILYDNSGESCKGVGRLWGIITVPIQFSWTVCVGFQI